MKPKRENKLSKAEQDILKGINLKRAYNSAEVLNMKFKSMDLQGEWLKHLGKACKMGSWFVCGKSGNGKTTYALKLAKYLTNHGRVHYVSIEQDISGTLQNSMEIAGLKGNEKNFRLVSESYLELIKRLLQQKSPDIIFLDSLQTMRYDLEGTRGINYANYRKLIKMFPDKLFVIISKAQGAGPWDAFALNVKFDSDIKIWVENYLANIETTRYGGGGDAYDVWPGR